MNEFNSTQLRYIDWLAASKFERSPTTEQLLAKELGITDRTLRRWKLLPGFREAITQRARELLGEDLNEIYGALRREAIKGSFHHIKLALELTGEHTDKIKVDDWRTELIELLKAGKITWQDVERELDPELVKEVYDFGGLQFVTASESQAQSAEAR
jgi:hypothetical protein